MWDKKVKNREKRYIYDYYKMIFNTVKFYQLNMLAQLLLFYKLVTKI